MSDDLASLFDAPSTAAQPMRYRSGLVLAWNPADLSNVVLVGSTPMANLPVLGVSDSASITPGSTVGLVVIGSTIAILGLFVTPGTPEAIAAVSRLSQRIFIDEVNTVSEGTSSTTYVDLATVGPRVDVPVGASGRVLVFLSAGITGGAAGGTMGVLVTNPAGTTLRDPLDETGLTWSASGSGAAVFYVVTTRMLLIDGLPPGVTCTFTAKYVAVNGTPAFIGRGIVVFTL